MTSSAHGWYQWFSGLVGFAFVVAAFLPASVEAEVTRVVIEDRSAFAEGESFGPVGAYERIKGKMYIEVDPDGAANRKVVDLHLAPRNARGKVEFWTDFFLLKPVDAKKGNGRILYDVNNRGNKLVMAAMNEARSNDPKTAADAGNGFLMRQGYAVLWCGWNGDVQPSEDKLLIDLPVAKEPTGQSITGKIYSEIRVDKPSFSEPLCWAGTKVYPAVSLDNATATLTMRPKRSAEPVEVARDRWAFARYENGQAVADPTYLYVKDGYKPGWLYDLVYVGKDPRVSGLGAVAVRDVVSFLRYEGKGVEGWSNPLAGAVERAYVFGISQSGRFIHHMIHQGFNGDARGRIVFDAAFCHVGAAGKAIFNKRFCQITRHGSPHEEHWYPSDVFPFTTVDQEDPQTGQRGNWLEESARTGHLPRIFITQTSTEYWARGGSLLHTDVDGRRDVALDPNVRLYHIAGGHHLFFTPTDQGINAYALNRMGYQPLLRALLVALDAWVTTGQAPPASAYPKIADGTLVDLAAYCGSFPRIPGVRLPESFYAPLRLDCGPRWASEGIADFVPPKVGQAYRTLVPAVDEDGNELAGIRMPDRAVPLATHAGWNLRTAASGAEGMLARWVGSSWPFARTAEDRKASGDPRKSVLERYPTREAYLSRVTEAVLKLRDERLVLDEDLASFLESAALRDDWSR